MIWLLFLFLRIRTKADERQFEIFGGVEKMYFYAEIFVGGNKQPESAILDTGSDMLSFPCTLCKNGDCGKHEHDYFNHQSSGTFSLITKCQSPMLLQKTYFCSFIKSYAEGSSLLGVLGND